MGHESSGNRTQSGAQELSIDEPLLLALACNDLPSGESSVRRPAIIALLYLAAQGRTAVRAQARKILKDEFGPYVLSHGFIGCAAPAGVACEIDDQGPCCHICSWKWADEVEALPPASPSPATARPLPP